MARAGVKAVHINEKMYLNDVTPNNLSLIQQPIAANASLQGSGGTVVVIDNGIDFTKEDFGSCTSLGNPSATCRVIAVYSIDNANVDHSHGNNVAATVLGVAPASKIISINIFDTARATSTSNIIGAINLSLVLSSSHNIVAINLSLGSSVTFSSPCGDDGTASAITSAKTAGISVVVAAGNGGDRFGLISPACVPDAFSVGAVYDRNMGVNFNTGAGCTDATTAPDQVVCFSNSASFLKLLAPGVNITSAGIMMSGTSQAAPHVAGAIAVLHAAFPSESLSQIQNRLINPRVPRVTDARNSLSFPRLDLFQAITPANNNFAAAIALSNANNSGNISSSY